MKSIITKLTTVCLLLATIGLTANNPIKEKKRVIKVALLLDTSNSMDGLISQAKSQLWDIVNELSYAKYGIQKPDLQIALYEYGNDRLESSDGYIRQVLSFSSDLDDISEKLFSLTTNGGKEYCGTVIQTSIKELKWGKDKNDLRLLFIAGNEPFTQGKIDYREAIADAKEKDVLINTIFCGGYDQGISGKWQDGANLGGGDYMIIDKDKKVVEIETPYDTQIIILNKKLNKTYIYYGKKGSANYSRQMKQDKNAESMSAPVSVKRAVTKSGRLYNNSSWDLVDAVEADETVIEEISENELPKELKGKTKKEIKVIVDAKKAERQKIQKEILELNKKRRVYIKEHQKTNGKKDELESVMIKAIKRQALLKNYTW